MSARPAGHQCLQSVTSAVQPVGRDGGRVRVNVVGVAIDVTTYERAVERIERLIAEGGAHYVCVNSAQDIIIAQDDRRFRRIVNAADLATADGWPVAWTLRARGHDQPGRITGPDLMLRLCARSAATGHSHLFYGGGLDVPQRLAVNLQRRFPGLRVAGAYSPPFRPLTAAEDDEVVAWMNRSGADVLWVGLGTPKQHFWIDEHLGRVRIPMMLGVGAAFDFYSGRIRRAPGWMQQHGLEWFHRLCQEPRRLWWRYVNYLPRFAVSSTAQRWGWRRYPINGVNDL
jgi:N-acetylglucosaminyldiphosphoundecaprenol N-acetyl-beta-D-mannosaminyltransferase